MTEVITCLRILIDKTDGLRATAHADEVATPLELSLERPELAEVAQCIKAGDRLNLIGARVKGKEAEADYIVYNPDYLVNITTIAQCFQSYGTDARVAIVNKFAAPANTAAINLGNFASQLLDEEIHGGGRPYAESISDFFRTNAVNLATCDLPSTFHADAHRQIENIHKAISDDMPAHVADFDRRRVMLEPAFVSEILGMQGRMDLLQLDYRVLMEQKSGKGAWPQGDYSLARHTVQHYVQLLLYRAIMQYNYPARYAANGGRLNSFLLYSRYTQPLVPLGEAAGLLREAFAVRNRLVALEMALARGETDFLTTLTPERLTKNPFGKLWENFQRPQLAAILDPIAGSDPQERAYFLRMLRFVATEHLLSKTGSGGATGFAATWRCTTAEKEDAGNIYCGLALLEPQPNHLGKVESVVLRFADDGKHSMANFREGDLVMLYNYPAGEEPDARSAMIHRATITAITENIVSLALRFAQTSPLPFTSASSKLWAIEHDYMEASHASLYRGLHSFLTAPAERRDLLLLRRAPRTDSTRRLCLDHGGFNELAMRVRQARDLFLLIGPPGTGKTSFGLMTTLKEQLAAEPSSQVLLLAFTNRAVDEICGKLADEGIDFLRIGPSLSCSPRFRPYLLNERAKACSRLTEVRTMIKDARVVAATTASINAASNIFTLKTFDLAIIDESSQITEPNIIGLLSATNAKGECVVRKMVMIGDHKQLPAVVQQDAAESAVTEPELRRAGLTDCRLSLFERLLRRYGSNPAVTYMLTRQGRMHADIADFASRLYYGSLLQPVPLPHQTAPLSDKGGEGFAAELFNNFRIAFVDVEAAPDSNSGDKVNLTEARFIATAAAEIARREGGLTPDTLGVIVPYRNQIAAVRGAMAALGIDTDMVTVDTVERFQGSQRQYIIYGLTVKRPVQLDFLCDNTFTDSDGTTVDRKLNVALTRAREHMVIAGDAALVSRKRCYRDLIDYLRERHAVFVYN